MDRNDRIYKDDRAFIRALRDTLPDVKPMREREIIADILEQAFYTVEENERTDLLLAANSRMIAAL